MAEEVEMTPVSAAEPPKANLLAKPGAPAVSTLKLNSVVHKPTAAAGGAPSAALKPGLKLPSKSGLATGGLKLPPKPVIRRPGATVAAAPVPKPVARAATPAADAPKPLETLKAVTQNLKSVTQEIPQQAILRKTGIIAEGAMTEAQKEAAKHKTARISLSDAMGVAPVKDENAPMKTIRIKRPINLPASSASAKPQPPAATPAVADAAASAAPAAPSPSMTQRKTLKIARPAGGGAVRPFGVKQPAAAKPAEGAPAAEVADIPDMPTVAPVPRVAAAEEKPSWVWTLSAVVQLAACVVVGVVAYLLYQNTQTNYF